MTMNAVVALNPAQMQEASSTMRGWAEAKLAAAKAELEEADSLHDKLLRAGVRGTAAKAMMNRAAKRVTFYAKVLAAVTAGYYVIPPFNNLQVFAVRTARKTPNERRSEYLSRRDHEPEGLAAGAGRWINPNPVVQQVDTETRPAYNSSDPAKTRDVAIYGATMFRDEIDLPVVAMKPQIIDAVGIALEAKVFDALAIAPGAERNADPIIAGLLRRPGSRTPLTFLIAWWLDEADL
jgi:hypothetical protein